MRAPFAQPGDNLMPCLLIADADHELNDLFGRFFRDRGFDVVTASNGLECLTKLQASVPDVLVLDLHMQWGGGDGVLAWMRDDARFPMFPLAFITGDDTPADLSRRTGIPVLCCLQKPFYITVLLQRIQSVAARNRYRDALSENGRPREEDNIPFRPVACC